MLQYPVRPMLAQLHPTPGDMPGEVFPFNQSGWMYEPKYNGHRLVVRQSSQGDIVMWSRSGREVSHEYPEIVAGMKAILGHAGPLVLDGEVIAMKDGRESPGHLGVHKRKEAGVFIKYVAFDVLALGQEILTQHPLSARGAVLNDLFDARNEDRRVTRAVATDNGVALWQAIIDSQSEGIIAKPVTSRYIEAERGTWLKIKRNEREVLWVVGYTTGERSRAPLFGALILARWDGKEFRYAGKCGTGNYTDRSSEDMQDLMDSKATTEAPFLSREYEKAMKRIAPGTRDIVWLTPELQAVIEYADKSRDGIPQFPSWKCWA